MRRSTDVCAGQSGDDPDRAGQSSWNPHRIGPAAGRVIAEVGGDGSVSIPAGAVEFDLRDATEPRS